MFSCKLLLRISWLNDTKRAEKQSNSSLWGPKRMQCRPSVSAVNTFLTTERRASRSVKLYLETFFFFFKCYIDCYPIYIFFHAKLHTWKNPLISLVTVTFYQKSLSGCLIAPTGPQRSPTFKWQPLSTEACLGFTRWIKTDPLQRRASNLTSW